MSTTVFNTKITLRKDTADNFAKVASTFVPLDGEVCIVDTGATGIRLKVGDGVKNFASLSYIDEDVAFKQSIIIGYYYEGEFFTDTVKTSKYTLYGKQLYLDYITNYIYYYNGTKLVRCEVSIPSATSEKAGIIKLYTQQGQNEDGAITQKFFTDSINVIKFSAIDSEECLILDKPW